MLTGIRQMAELLGIIVSFCKVALLVSLLVDFFPVCLSNRLHSTVYIYLLLHSRLTPYQ
jgi:hypothetical protein